MKGLWNPGWSLMLFGMGINMTWNSPATDYAAGFLGGLALGAFWWFQKPTPRAQRASNPKDAA